MAHLAAAQNQKSHVARLPTTKPSPQPFAYSPARIFKSRARSFENVIELNIINVRDRFPQPNARTTHVRSAFLQAYKDQLETIIAQQPVDTLRTSITAALDLTTMTHPRSKIFSTSAPSNSLPTHFSPPFTPRRDQTHPSHPPSTSPATAPTHCNSMRGNSSTLSRAFTS